MCHIFFIHSSVDGHFGCFHVLAIVNRAVKRVMYHIFLFKLVFSFSLYKCPEVELLDNIVVLFLIFWENSILYSIAVETIYILTNSAWGFPFSTSSSTLFISCVLDNNHSNMCEVISHCGLNLHFLDDQRCWASFYVSVGRLYVYFCKMSTQTFYPFF